MMVAATFTDIIEVKKILQIPLEDRSLDYALNYYIMTATGMISEFLNRPNFYKQERTEYYQGTGTQKLLLNSRPVYIDPEPIIYTDYNGVWGEDPEAFQNIPDNEPLEFGRDFAVWLDTINPATGIMDRSRCGIIVRRRSYWPKPAIRQTGFLSPFVGQSFGNVKITYTAGYTLDDMPAQIRMACIMIVVRFNYLNPLGIPISSESYEERHITFDIREDNFLMGQIKHLISSFRNHKF